MTAEERAAKIEAYGTAHAQLVAALREFPEDMWHYQDGPDSWSIHDTVIHITDSEANSYTRCRRLIAEPGATVMAYDENRWLRELHYTEQSTDDALELFKWLRRHTYHLIQSLPDAVWAHTIEHPENGTMTMDDWLDVYTQHVPQHITQMHETYAAWRAQQS